MSETPWAKVPRSVVERVRCDACLRLLTYLDLRQGDAGRPVRGIGEVSDVLGWQHRTTAKHAEHLAAAGLIELDPEPIGASGRRSWGNTRLRVLHNPARARYSDRLAVVEGVWDAIPERWRPAPGLDTLPGANAERVAPSVRPDDETDDARIAPSVRPEARRASPKGATRLNGGTNAERAAPSVPLSPRSEPDLCAPEVYARTAVAMIEEAFGDVEVIERESARCSTCGSRCITCPETIRSAWTTGAAVSSEADAGVPGDARARDDWWDLAECLGMDPEMFFPRRGEPVALALRTCRGCPVRSDCLAYALAEGEPMGVWGGTTERGRRRLRRLLRDLTERTEEDPMDIDELVSALRDAGYVIDLAPGEREIVLAWDGFAEPAPALAALAREVGPEIHDRIVAERMAAEAAYAVLTDVEEPEPGWEPTWPLDEFGM